MRSLRVRDGVRQARTVLSDAWGLMRATPLATLELGLVLALLPALIKAFFAIGAQGTLIGVWEGWFDRAFSGGTPESLLTMLNVTLSASGRLGLGANLVELVRSLVLTPLLLSSLALLYNGYVLTNDRAAISAARMAGKRVRDLILVALLCMVAQWFVQMVPSLASGVLSLLAEMLGWIPVLGTIARTLAVMLSLLVSLLTDFAVVVIFCYVWICAVCEGVPGFGALVRSWQLTRNAMRETIFALLSLLLCRFAAIVLLSLLWVFAGRPAGIPLAALIYLVFAVGALYNVWAGAVTSALYRRRPSAGAPRPGQFNARRPDLDTMKRANID